MYSIFWGNYKGGVGKTTSTFQIAGYFALNNKKVLLIDLDPQCSLSNLCYSSGFNEDLERINVEKTLNYILELYMRDINSNNNFAFQLLARGVNNIYPGEYCVIKKCIEKTIHQFTNQSLQNNYLYFIPSCLHLQNCRINELAQLMSENVYNIFLMKLFLDAIREIGKDNENLRFDYVFFDCPPTTNILIQSVFLASDYYIIPTICDEVSTKGVPDYIHEIEQTRNKYSLNDKIRGILIETIFPKKPQFIGLFETLYKNRKDGLPHNHPIITSLDNNIDKLKNVVSILSSDKFLKYRYDPRNSNNPGDFATKNIFNESIYHVDARKSGESVPRNTGNAEITEEYRDIASMIMEMML